MAASLSSADKPLPARRLEARVRRRIREADQDERLMVATVTAQLGQLQATIREVVAGQSTAPFPVVINDIDRRVTVAAAAITGGVNDHVALAAGFGSGLIDELLALAGTTGRLPAADHTSLLARLGTHTEILVTSALGLVTMATSSQLALLQSGRQDLAATLAAIGGRLGGSVVFGRAAERLTGATTALTGEAFGHAQQDRAVTHPDRDRLAKRWISSHKADARSTHSTAEARYSPGGSIGPIPYGDDFAVGPYRAPYPRGPGLPGAQKVHCGCRLLPVITEPQPSARRTS